MLIKVILKHPRQQLDDKWITKLMADLDKMLAYLVIKQMAQENVRSSNPTCKKWTKGMKWIWCANCKRRERLTRWRRSRQHSRLKKRIRECKIIVTTKIRLLPTWTQPIIRPWALGEPIMSKSIMKNKKRERNWGNDLEDRRGRSKVPLTAKCNIRRSKTTKWASMRKSRWSRICARTESLCFKICPGSKYMHLWSFSWVRSSSSAPSCKWRSTNYKTSPAFSSWRAYSVYYSCQFLDKSQSSELSKRGKSTSLPTWAARSVSRHLWFISG